MANKGGQQHDSMIFRFIFAAAIGALLMYFLDPDRGKRRRNITRDRALAMTRRGARWSATQARYAGSTARGLGQKVAHSGDPKMAFPDDATLAHKVESELFRDPVIPKGNININAENGVVVLRGEVRHPEDIDDLVSRVRRIEGVHSVESLLHLPDTAAPMS